MKIHKELTEDFIPSIEVVNSEYSISTCNNYFAKLLINCFVNLRGLMLFKTFEYNSTVSDLHEETGIPEVVISKMLRDMLLEIKWYYCDACEVDESARPAMNDLLDHLAIYEEVKDNSKDLTEDYLRSTLLCNIHYGLRPW